MQCYNSRRTNNSSKSNNLKRVSFLIHIFTHLTAKRSSVIDICVNILVYVFPFHLFIPTLFRYVTPVVTLVNIEDHPALILCIHH